MANLDDLQDLPEFINHDNETVRLQALQVLIRFTTIPEARDLLSDLSMISLLKKRLDDFKSIIEYTIKALINLSDHDKCRQQMYDQKLITVILIHLSDKKYPHPHLLSILLSNLTGKPEGAEKLMQKGSDNEGNTMIKLIELFLSSRSSSTALCDRAYLSHTIANISQIPIGQKLLIEKGFIPRLSDEIQTADAPNKPTDEQLTANNLSPPVAIYVRRLGIFTTIKNCFIDLNHHSYLLSTESKLYPSILYPIAGPGRYDEEDIFPMHDLIQKLIRNPHRRRDPSFDIRRLSIDIITLCGRHKPSRLFLRKRNIYYLLREYHEWEEKINNNQEMDELLHDMVPIYLLDEEKEEGKPDMIQVLPDNNNNNSNNNNNNNNENKESITSSEKKESEEKNNTTTTNNNNKTDTDSSSSSSSSSTESLLSKLPVINGPPVRSEDVEDSWSEFL